ncbi:MAG: homoserine kinase [Planctomycetota bacterium]
MTRWRIHAPSSSANLGPGFDVLGLALELGITLELEAESPKGFGVEISGEGAESLPRDQTHRIVSVAAEIAGEAAEKALWKVHSSIPMARGLGSSAAAHACGVAAGFLLRDGTHPSADQVFQKLSDIEGHPDNAAACIDGGLQAGSGKAANWARVPLPLKSIPRLLTVIPEVPLETKRARAALPDQYPRQDAIVNLGALAHLVAGLAHGDWQAIHEGCVDQLHQPFRLPLIPGLTEALESLRQEEQLSGGWLSGAGPTLAAFVPDQKTNLDVATAALEALARADTPAHAKILAIDATGLRIESLA